MSSFSLLPTLGEFLLLVIGVYVLVRVGAAGWFKSKQQFGSGSTNVKEKTHES